MERNDYILLIYKKLDNEISETELSLLNDWLSKDAANQSLADDLVSAYEASTDYLKTEAETVDLDAAFATQLGLLDKATLQNLISPKEKKERKLPFLKIIGAAAAVLFLSFIGFQYLEYRTQAEAIVSSENEAKTVTFVDGSVAILAPNSTIKYSNYFNKKGRFVELVKGEVNFSVVKEKGQFRVKTSRELVTVLGTIFDVKLEKNQTIVSVTEGKVNVRQNVTKQGQTDTKFVDLVAGESVVSMLNSLVKTKADKEKALNYFEFQESSLKTVVTNLENYFNTKISINSSIEICRLTVTFDEQSLEEILVILDKLLNTKHQKNNDGFEILGESCQ